MELWPIHTAAKAAAKIGVFATANTPPSGMMVALWGSLSHIQLSHFFPQGVGVMRHPGMFTKWN